MDGFLIPTVPANHEKTEELLGQDWLKDQVASAIKTLNKKQNTPLHPATMSPEYGWHLHPLVSELKQHHQRGEKTLILDKLEQDIRVLSDTSLPIEFSERLKDDHDCEKAAYEISIAAGFRRLGFPIVWCPPVKSHHPEFFVDTGTHGLLGIECKKRDASDGYEKEAGRFWRHLQHPLMKKMQRESLNYWIKVTGRELILNDVEHLVDEIISMLKKNKNGQFTSNTGRYQVEYTQLVEEGGSVPMDVINLFPRGVYGVNAMKQDKGQIMSGPATDPKLIRLELIDEPKQRIKGLLRNLNDASKQVVKGIISLIYIDVNLSQWEQEQAEFNDMKQTLVDELKIRHKHVTAVILTDIYRAKSLDEIPGWRVRTEFIQQTQPTLGLPESLKFPGDLLDSPWLSGDLYEMQKVLPILTSQ